MADVKLVDVVLVPGLEEKIRELGVQMFGEDSRDEAIEHLIALLLPDLVQNALAGDILPPTGEQLDDGEDVAGDSLPQGVAEAIAAAAERYETPDVKVPLEVAPEPVQKAETPVDLTFDEVVATGQVHPDAVAWAKGHPGREAALVETCMGMPFSLWGMSKMPTLAERTYNMRAAQKEDDIRS